MILGVNDAMLSWVCRVVLQNSVAPIMCHTVTSSVSIKCFGPYPTLTPDLSICSSCYLTLCWDIFIQVKLFFCTVVCGTGGKAFLSIKRLCQTLKTFCLTVLCDNQISYCSCGTLTSNTLVYPWRGKDLTSHFHW